MWYIDVYWGYHPFTEHLLTSVPGHPSTRREVAGRIFKKHAVVWRKIAGTDLSVGRDHDHLEPYNKGFFSRCLVISNFQPFLM